MASFLVCYLWNYQGYLWSPSFAMSLPSETFGVPVQPSGEYEGTVLSAVLPHC